jgi:hypothetical protein
LRLTEGPNPMSPTDCLGATWTDLVARLDAEKTLVRWGLAEPALADLASLCELAAIVHGGRQLERTDRIFGALLRTAAVAGGGDQDAGLVIGHLLSNATRKMAIRLRDLSEDIDALIASALWVEIRAFRWRHRQRGYAKGLLLDTRTAVLGDLCPERTADGARVVSLLSPGMAAALADDLLEGGVSEGLDAGPVDDEQELQDVLAWALRSGVLPAEDIALLVELELASVDHRRASAAARGVHERTLRRRCNRAKTRLYEARLAYLEQAA